jgi:hypothetical protein
MTDQQFITTGYVLVVLSIIGLIYSFGLSRSAGPWFWLFIYWRASTSISLIMSYKGFLLWGLFCVLIITIPSGLIFGFDWEVYGAWCGYGLIALIVISYQLWKVRKL